MAQDSPGEAVEPPSPPGWTVEGASFAKRFSFGGFAEALAFMVEVGLHCEKVGHHPDWANSYDRVSVRLTTHDAGQVTEKDWALARHMDAVYGRSHRA